MENNKQYTYPGPYGIYQVYLQMGKYNNGRAAIQLIDANDHELVTTATINLVDADIPEGHVAIKDYSENEGMLEWLMKNEIVSEPLTYESSGFILAPVCKILIDLPTS